MKKIENEIYQLSKSEYERLREGATLGQSNNSPGAIASYYIIQRKESMDLLEYQLSLWHGSKASFTLYKRVTPSFICIVSGIPMDHFFKVIVNQ